MSGLYLRSGMSAGVSYSPMTVASSPPAQSSGTIAQQAYGINGSGGPRNGNVPGYGSVAAGLIAVGLLTYIYVSLPR